MNDKSTYEIIDIGIIGVGLQGATLIQSVFTTDCKTILIVDDNNSKKTTEALMKKIVMNKRYDDPIPIKAELTKPIVTSRRQRRIAERKKKK